MSSSFGLGKSLYLLVLSFLIFQVCVGALTSGEEEALMGLFNAFPDLSHIPLSDLSLGPSWVSGLPQLCDNDGDGFYHGLTCWGGHIGRIEFSDAWGEPQINDFSFLSNLTFLRTFIDSSDKLNPLVTFPLIEALAPHVGFEELYIRWPSESLEEWKVLENETSLYSLTGSIPSTFNFSQLSSIETVYALSSSRVTWDLFPVSNTLKYLTLEGHDMSDESQLDLILSGIPNLSYFSCGYCVWPETTAGYVDLNLPTSLSSMVLYNPEGLGASGVFRISSTRLTTSYMEFWDFPTTGIEMVSVPSLGRLLMSNCENVDIGSLDMSSMTDLTINKPKNETWYKRYLEGEVEASIWMSMVVLEKLEIEGGMTLNESEWILCSIAQASSSNFKSLSIINYAGTGHLPSCFPSSFPSLTHLSIKGWTGFGSHWVLQVVPPSIKSIHIDRAFQLFFNLASSIQSRSNLASLEELSIINNNAAGTIPQNIFSEILPSLTSLILSNNSLSGTIPPLSNISSNVKVLRFDGNSLSGWNENEESNSGNQEEPNSPSFEEPNSPPPSFEQPSSFPLLSEIILDRNNLSFIPSDSSFSSSSMPSLLSFSANSNPILSGPLPLFFSNHDSLQSFSISQCNLSGTFPSSLSSPNLLEIDLSKNNFISGSLPSSPTWKLRLNGNQLTGGIPQTWVNPNYPIHEIELQNNQFSGTIPSSWLSSLSSSRASLINLSNNSWNGNIFDLSHITKSITLNIQETNLDFCSFFADFNHISNQSYPSNPLLETKGTCLFDYGAICGCEEAYTSCQVGNGFQIQPSVPYSGDCYTYPTQPSPSQPPSDLCSGRTSSLPPGFSCDPSTGSIFSPSSILSPSINLPSNLGIVTIQGNLTVDSSITLNGITTSIIVTGCISAPDGLVIKFSEDDLDQPDSSIPSDPLTLLSQNSSCSNSLQNINIQIQSPKSCKKIKTDISQSSRASLNVAFTIDSSACNTKWIILGSVLGAVVVIGVIIIVVAIKLSSNARSKVLPYHGAN